MTGFDFVVLIILSISSGLGLIRGLLKEVLSLLAYGLAFVAAVFWGPFIHILLFDWIETPFLRIVIAYSAVFIMVLLSIGLVNLVLAMLIKSTGLSPADHGCGALFGLLRGFLCIIVLVILAGYTPIPQELWWRDAILSQSTERTIQYIQGRLPPEIACWLPYFSRKKASRNTGINMQ